MDANSNFEWTNDLIMEFITLYEKHPEIWEAKNKNHKNRNVVSDAWNNIKNNFSLNVSVSFLKKKRECLMATYRNLNKKIAASKKSGAGTDDIYKPSWFAYDAMDAFLGKTGSMMHSVNTEDYDFGDEGRESEGSIQVTETVNELNSSNTIEIVSESPKETPIKKKRLSSSTVDLAIQDTMKQATQALKDIKSRTRNPEKKDECQIFGELLATKLKALSQRSQKILMHKINNLVFEAEMMEIDNEENTCSFHACNLISQAPPQASTMSDSLSCGSNSQKTLTSGCPTPLNSPLVVYYSEASETIGDQSIISPN